MTLVKRYNMTWAKHDIWTMESTDPIILDNAHVVIFLKYLIFVSFYFCDSFYFCESVHFVMRMFSFDLWKL